MSFVRNTKTNKYFEISKKEVAITEDSTTKATYKPVKQSSLFGKSVEEKIQDQYGDFLNDIKQHLPKDWSEVQKNLEIKKLIAKIATDPKNFDKMVNDPKLQQSFQEMGNNKKASDPYAISELIKLIGSSYAAFGFPLTMLAAAAAQSTLQTHTGQPDGGLDLCSGYIFGCIQGYLTNGTEPWSLDMPQFNRLIQGINSDADRSSSSYLQFRKCLDDEKIASIVQTAYESGTSSTKEICSAASTYWEDFQATSQVTALPKDACSTFQNTFAAESQQCMSSWNALGYGVAITGGVVGGLCLLACCAGAFYYACKHSDKLDCRRNSNN